MINKLAKKLDLPEELVSRFLAEEHLYQNHYKNLKTMEEFQLTDLDKKTLKMINKTCKTLKISPDAMVSVVLQLMIENGDVKS